MNCIHNRQLLTVPSGNDFRIHLCRRDVAPGNHADVTFVDIQDLKAYVTGFPNLRIFTTHQVHDDGDIIVDIDSTKLQHYTYGIELTGRYNGHPWRWKCDKVFKVSDTNCESSVQGMESFGVETYYIGDVVDVDFEYDSVIFASEGHVYFEGDALVLQDTEDTSFGFEEDALVIYDNKIN